MSYPPNDHEKPKSVSKSNKSKRARRTGTTRRSSSTVPRGELLAHCPPESRQLIEHLFSLSPLEMLGLVIMLEMRDRMTDAHLEALCNIYYNLLMYSGTCHD